MSKSTKVKETSLLKSIKGSLENSLKKSIKKSIWLKVAIKHYCLSLCLVLSVLSCLFCESCLLMCDLSAALDTVPHQVLLDKLAPYGLSEAALAWFKITVENIMWMRMVGSPKGEGYQFGVFQGSIAGPILFIIFFNDLVTLQDAPTKISIYADDNNYKLKLGNDVKENKRLINNTIVQGSSRGVHECQQAEVQCRQNSDDDHDTQEEQDKQYFNSRLQWT